MRRGRQDCAIVRRKPVSREPSVPTAMTPLDLTIEKDPVLSAAAGTRGAAAVPPGRAPGGRLAAGRPPGGRGRPSPGRTPGG